MRRLGRFEPGAAGSQLGTLLVDGPILDDPNIESVSGARLDLRLECGKARGAHPGILIQAEAQVLDPAEESAQKEEVAVQRVLGMNLHALSEPPPTGIRRFGHLDILAPASFGVRGCDGALQVGLGGPALTVWQCHPCGVVGFEPAASVATEGGP